MTEIDLDAVAAAEAVGVPKSFKEWMVVARGLDAGRHWAMKQAGTHRPAGPSYSRTFNLWLNQHHPSLGQLCPKSMQWALFWCLERLEEIEAWLATLPAPEQARLSHPAKVLARFLVAPDEPGDPRGDRIAELERQVRALRDEIARLRARERG